MSISCPEAASADEKGARPDVGCGCECEEAGLASAVIEQRRIVVVVASIDALRVNRSRGDDDGIVWLQQVNVLAVKRLS